LIVTACVIMRIFSGQQDDDHYDGQPILARMPIVITLAKINGSAS